ncbi:hypothetical protein H1P_520019 [Hyella patelloides LEGE 07179]|uniref:Uncharacterized protein n=1 Tax=Hyella patelloides LEGE 07179 TaxID=945734 RepID=A0A563VZU2_9CYAN|nr:hypothetical protein H1P_520019 [Hyella patelloides LEGE 07179]
MWNNLIKQNFRFLLCYDVAHNIYQVNLLNIPGISSNLPRNRHEYHRQNGGRQIENLKSFN